MLDRPTANTAPTPTPLPPSTPANNPATVVMTRDEKSTPTQPFIVYSTRKMTVIDGLPYYQSTGKNSHCSNAWLPFVYVEGVVTLSLNALPLYIDEDNLEMENGNHTFGHIVKVTRNCLRDNYKVSEHIPQGLLKKC